MPIVSTPTLQSWASAEIESGTVTRRAQDRAAIVAAIARHAGVAPAALTMEHVDAYCATPTPRRPHGASAGTVRAYRSMTRCWLRFCQTGDSVSGGRAMREEIEAFRTWLMAGGPGRRALAQSSATERYNAVSAVSRWCGVHPRRLRPVHVEAWRAGNRQCSAVYRNAVLASLKVYAAFAVIEDPTAGIIPELTTRKPAKGRPPAQRDVMAMLAVADDVERAVMILGLCAGLRPHEIGLLAGRDIDVLDTGGAEILVSDGKGGHQRYVNLGPAEVAALAPVWQPGMDGDLFPRWTRTTKRAAGAYVGACVRDLRKRAGLGRITAHQLRHWFASQAYEDNQGDLLQLKELLGHRSLGTTQHYITTLNQTRKGVALSAGLGERLFGAGAARGGLRGVA